MRRIGLSVTALVTASALAACGSSSSGGTSSSPTGGSSPSSTAFDATAAQQTAQSAVLTLNDLPAGWTSTPNQDSAADDAALFGKLASCLQVSPTIFAKSGPGKVEVSSPDFASPNNGATGGVSENVDVETPAGIAAEFAAVHSSKLTGCMQTVYTSFLRQKFAQDPSTKGVTIGTVTAVRGHIPTYGDESDGVEITVPLSAGTTNTSEIIDLIFIRVGNISANISFQNTGGAFDTATAASITSKAAAKLTAAAG